MMNHQGMRVASLLCVAVVGLGIVAVSLLSNQPLTAAEGDMPIMHSVFFTLTEPTDEARAHLTAACQKYLTGHPGCKAFYVGARVATFDRPVNDQEFDVALHIVFENQAAHDRYQTAERHLQFIEENRGTWKNVRVFDAYVVP